VIHANRKTGPVSVTTFESRRETSAAKRARGDSVRQRVSRQKNRREFSGLTGTNQRSRETPDVFGKVVCVDALFVLGRSAPRKTAVVPRHWRGNNPRTRQRKMLPAPVVIPGSTGGPPIVHAKFRCAQTVRNSAEVQVACVVKEIRASKASCAEFKTRFHCNWPVPDFAPHS